MKVITMRVSDEGNDYESVMKIITMRVYDEGNNYESV
jgi:hypothetical protein